MATVSSLPQPALPAWTRVYNYTSKNCQRSGCRKCWDEIQKVSPQQVPSSLPDSGSDYLWITPSFFRFQEEAQRYLALPPYNSGEMGLYIEIPPMLAGNLPWKVCQGAGYPNQPGGALEYHLSLTSPIPVVESFETIPHGMTHQPNSQGTSADFHFDTA